MSENGSISKFWPRSEENVIYKNITFLYGGNRFPSHLKYQQLHEIISVHIIQVLVIYIHYKNKV